MRGICGHRFDGGVLNCPFNEEAQPLGDTGLQKLQDVCPQLAAEEDGSAGRYCCTEEQLDVLQVCGHVSLHALFAQCITSCDADNLVTLPFLPAHGTRSCCSGSQHQHANSLTRYHAIPHHQHAHSLTRYHAIPRHQHANSLTRYHAIPRHQHANSLTLCPLPCPDLT
jgi:hypothetical protein